MKMLTKELALYERDETGSLIPQEVSLVMSEKDQKDYPEYVGSKIKIIPMTRGELRKIFNLTGVDDDAKPVTNKDDDGKVIAKYCIDPTFTEQELEYIKPVLVRSIVKTIFIESGVKIDETTGEKKINDNDEFGKNS